MELYHKITKEVLELLLKEGEQMPVDLARKLQRSSSNMQQVREYLSKIGCIDVKKQRNFYELKITARGTTLLELMRGLEKIDNGEDVQPLKLNQDSPSVNAGIKESNKDFEDKEVKMRTVTKEMPPQKKAVPTSEETISRGGRRGIMKRFG